MSATAFGQLIGPGFFSNQTVQIALCVGAMTAATSAVVGVFTVIRGHSFGGHALTDVSAAGGAGALLAGMSPLSGFVVGGILGAGAIGSASAHTTRRADVATGVVLGTAGGLAALFLYLEATGGTTTGSTQQILFGSIFALDTSVLPFVGALGALATALTLLCYRPLVLSSVDAEIARARGIPLRLVGIVYMVSLALAVALSSLSVGAVLSTALLVGPAACAIKVARSLSSAIALAVLIAVATTEVGILASYDSYYWVASHDAMPVSFFVVAAVLVAYAICSALAALSARVVTSGRRALGD